jgi:methionyl-tRNA formyltransferase
MRVIFWGSDRGVQALLYLLNIKWTVQCCVCENSPELFAICKKHGIQVTTQSELNAEVVRRLDSDIGISYFYCQKIKEPYYELPRYHTINFHPAPLPEHRGTGGCCYALLNDYKQWAVTAHFIDKTFDTGDIIEVISFDISRLRTAIAVEFMQSKQLFNLFVKTMTRLEQNPYELPRIPQKAENGHYFSRKDLLAQKSVTLQESNKELNKKIHALWFPPHEGAYIEKDGERFYLLTRELLDEIGELYEKFYKGGIAK